MSNVLAGIGRGQLRILADRVDGKRRIFAQYRDALADLPGVTFLPERNFARSTRWLTCLTIDHGQAGFDRDVVIQKLEKNNIESRPTWKPMHLQSLYKGCEAIGGQVAEEIFNNGICLPSGTSMTEKDLARIITIVCGCWK